MPFLTQGKTNWKYILIVVILAIIVGGGILVWIKMQEVSLSELPKIEKPEEKIEQKNYDIYKKSKITGYVRDGRLHYKGEFLDPGFHEVEDYCYLEYSSKPSQKGNYLKEYYTVSGTFKGQTINNKLLFVDRRCNCIDGACVKPSSVESCTDTDEGWDIFLKGEVIGIRRKEDFISMFEDYCDRDGSAVLEGFCTEGINYDYSRRLCEFGCDDGTCRKNFRFLSGEISRDKCYDSDGGKDYYKLGETYGDYVGGASQKYFVVLRDHCISENQLNEVYCLDSTQSSVEAVSCECSGGVCLD